MGTTYHQANTNSEVMVALCYEDKYWINTFRALLSADWGKPKHSSQDLKGVASEALCTCSQVAKPEFGLESI